MRSYLEYRHVHHVYPADVKVGDHLLNDFKHDAVVVAAFDETHGTVTFTLNAGGGRFNITYPSDECLLVGEE